MNNKELIAQIAATLGKSETETQADVSALIDEMLTQLQDGQTIAIQGFGSFEVKKKLEHIALHPATQQRMLVPPKLALAFKPSPLLKEKIK